METKKKQRNNIKDKEKYFRLAFSGVGEEKIKHYSNMSSFMCVVN